MKRLISAAVLVLSVALAQVALADTRSGALGAAASASDYYQVTCSDDGSGPPASFSVQVSDEAPASAPIVSVQVRVVRTSPDSYAAGNSSDPADADGAPSPVMAANAGAGPYEVFVDKTAAGTESYVITFLCTTGAGGSGVRTGTEITASSVAAPVPLIGFAARFVLGALMLIGLARNAGAHTQSGSLGTGAGATDFYQVTCTNDGAGAPASLAIQVQDAGSVAAPLLSVQARKGLLLVSSTDPNDGDSGFSPLVSVNGGEGVYDVLVDKTASGAESYTLSFHCTTGADGGGDETGTEIVSRQSQ